MSEFDNNLAEFDSDGRLVLPSNNTGPDKDGVDDVQGREERLSSDAGNNNNAENSAVVAGSGSGPQARVQIDWCNECGQARKHSTTCSKYVDGNIIATVLYACLDGW
jgi:hypothetical protein